jgi:AraC-like DNA-binding protein/mannose-6-phosphate isomerase-like protein (cupin superfamily)
MGSAQNENRRINQEVPYQSSTVYVPLNTGKFLVYYAEIINSTMYEFSHYHHCYEIYYVLKGSIKMKLNGKTVLLRKGHMILIMPEIEHEVEHNPAVDCQFFVITFEFYPRECKEINAYNLLLERFELETLIQTFKVQSYYNCVDRYECHTIIREIETELKDKDIGWNMKVQNLYLQFVITALRNITFPMPYPPYSRENVNSAIEISKYIRKHLHEDLTLKKVAKSLNMTSRNVSRVFKDYFGTTFGKTLSSLRFNFAKHYLATTDYSVDEIAKLVGYKSTRTLFKIFKENEGLTISQYRDKYSQYYNKS